jgi:hypothetical protein
MRVMTPLYKEIGACFMGDGWQSTGNRPNLNIHAASDGFVNVRRAFDASGQDKNMPFIANSMMTEMRTLGQENVFSCTMDGACKGALCSVMTSASACEHMWSIEGWIHNKRRNRLAQPNVEKAVRAHGNLVLRDAMLPSRQEKVAWNSQTNISEPDRRTNEQGVDDSDDYADSDASTAR